ncbi:MAG: endolytic transglycosylase MltG [Ruminococcus sp.]|uniref:endolytic transglycosylase MltG n=1 Tax=Ruminococcus sp. TaxID=41978 RepID=UPI0025E76166|nr:endolytic transglycosylase MltG [Ruminococcus sp.]MCR5601341.1 endolytic transglycosylase MltG [Ruminococcus sp.]
MADNKNNDDVINDILKQLDNAKNTSEAESEKQTEEPAETADRPIEETADAISEPVRSAPSHEAPQRKVISHAADNESAEPVRSNAEFRKPAQHQQEDDPPVLTRGAAAQMHNNPHHKKKKKKRNRLPGVLILTVFIFAVSICLSLVIIAFGRDMFGIGKSDTSRLIIVPEGASTEDISQLLYEEGIISSPKCFQFFSRFRKTPDQYIAGEHFVSPSMAYETIINKLTNIEEEEKKEEVTITFVEGKTIYDAAQLLEENGVCSADDFIFNFNAGGLGYRFEEYLPKEWNSLRFADARMEGYLFPDTYTFTKDMDPEQVCQKIYFNFNQKMSDERIERIKSLNYSMDEIITMASIVQKEAPNRADMNHVAGVFWNRLEHPEGETVGKLQSDPTSNYANFVIKPHLEVPNSEMLNAYDTYIGQGLPPGPICSPGLEAIDAVLEKMPTEDYYFVANIYTGDTVFAKTYDEHLQNDAKVKADEAAWEEQEEARIAAEEAAAAAAAEENYE